MSNITRVFGSENLLLTSGISKGYINPLCVWCTSLSPSPPYHSLPSISTYLALPSASLSSLPLLLPRYHNHHTQPILLEAVHLSLAFSLSLSFSPLPHSLSLPVSVCSRHSLLSRSLACANISAACERRRKKCLETQENLNYSRSKWEKYAGALLKISSSTKDL